MHRNYSQWPLLAPLVAVLLSAYALDARSQPEKAPFHDQIPKMMTVPNAIDSDSDGKLSTQEMLATPAQLKKLDKNGDGKLDHAEVGAYLKVLPLIRNHLIFNVIDTDGDAIISAQEIANASASLGLLDEDGNWELSEAEIRGERNPKAPVFNLRNRSVKLWEQFRSYTTENKGPILPGQDKRSFEGYILVHDAGDDNQIQVSNHDYLMDNNGKIVHEWKHPGYSPEASVAYLLPNGQLLRTYSKHHWTHDKKFPVGAFTTIQLVDWGGKTLWEYSMSAPEKYSFHHDVKAMPNGNILAIRYTGFTTEEAMAMGWDPALGKRAAKAIDKHGTGLVWMDSVLELKPNLANGSTEIVWQWNSWEHLVQAKYPQKRNFGDASNPARIHVNYLNLDTDVPFNKGQLFHMNSLDYNAELDMIVVSSPTYGEMWFIDHSTTTAEAATGEGGKRGKGGDLLYRWGNGEASGQGTRSDGKLFWQHDVHWIKKGLPGAGNLLVFNNGTRRTLDDKYITEDGPSFGRSYSNVLEVKMPMTAAGGFDADRKAEIAWSWENPERAEFYSPFMSGAERLPNGNTIFDRAYDKHIVEVNPKGEKVLDFSLPGWGRLHRVYKYAPDYPGLKF